MRQFMRVIWFQTLNKYRSKNIRNKASGNPAKLSDKFNILEVTTSKQNGRHCTEKVRC
jgi:hypothetical protein